MKKEIYKYTLCNENNKFTIYKTGNLNSNKIILCLSGGHLLCYDTYVQKIVLDFLNIDIIKNEFQIIIIEKLNKACILMYDDISKYLIELDKQIHIIELKILGFSSGGVTARHIMYALKELKFKKMIITYCTPYQVIDNVLSFEKYIFFRLDYYFYLLVYNTYLHHYNYEKIKEVVKYNISSHNAFGIVKMIKDVNKFTDKELMFKMGFNFNQTNNTKIINVYCKYDPIVNSEISLRYIEKYRGKLFVENIVMDCVGHCSNIAKDRLLTAILHYLIYL